MGELVEGDDGLPAEMVGQWAREKQDYLCRYLRTASATRKKWLGPGNAGATLIDLFSGPGRARVKETGEWIDGSVVAAWKASLADDSPFTHVLIGDADEERRQAAAERLRRLGAPVIELDGPALVSVAQAVSRINPYGLHFAFLDPYNLEALDFRIIETLAGLRRIDMLIHISQMDLQRNLDRNLHASHSIFDSFSPGWRDSIDVERGHQKTQEQIIQYWRDLVAGLGVWPSTDMRLIRGGKNQPLYWLLLAARHDLAHKFWSAASNVEGQGSFDF